MGSIPTNGTATKIPWSGYWWPMADKNESGADIINLYDEDRSMDKYDNYVFERYHYNPGAKEWESRSAWCPWADVGPQGHKVNRTTLNESTGEADWVYDNNSDGDLNDPFDFTGDGNYDDELDASWWGHCHGWSAASIKEPEPFMTSINCSGIDFTVGDQKGLLTELHCNDTYDLYKGTRYDGPGDDPHDIYPCDFHNWLIYWIGFKREPLVVDTDRLVPVSNYPAYRFEMDIQPDPNNPSREFVTCTVWFVDFVDDPDYVGNVEFTKVYTYNVTLNEYDYAVPDPNTCNWTDNSITNHPDFIWHPKTQRADKGCPLDYDIVKEICWPLTAYWPMAGHDPQRTGRSTLIGDLSGNLTYTPIIENDKLTYPAIADIDSDGKPEIVVSNEDAVRAFEGDGTHLWAYTGITDAINTPTIFWDVDSDGESEVVVETYNSKLYVLNAASGEYEWHYTTDYAIVSPPIVADVDEDGKQEIVFGDGYSISGNGYMYALNGDTQDELWKVTTGGYNTRQAMADVDSDGKPEIIGVNADGIFALNAEDGSVLWQKEYKTAIARPTIADFDNDGELEIAFGTWNFEGFGGHNRVYVVNAATGEPEFPPYTLTDWPGGISSGDVDGDGILELVFNTLSQDVYCLDGSTGALQFHYPRDGNGDIGGGQYIISAVAIADVDNIDDKDEPEIVVGSTEGVLDIIYYNGGSSYRVAHHNIGGIVEDPAIGDVDGDGKAEIVVRSSIYGTKSSSGDGSGVVRINHVPVVLNATFSTDAAVLIDTFHARADFESSAVQVINGPDPDLVLTESDISFDPAYPITSDNVTITATVHNQKNDSFTNKPFKVSFYDGEAQIGEDLVVDSVPAEGAVDASVVWQYPGAGLHNIRVVVDTGCSVPETDETNNEAGTEINVGVYPVHNLNTGEGFFTIQAAIDDYNTQQGHTINVGDRTYTENVDVWKRLTIQSMAEAPADTVIQAADSGDHVFDVTADYVDISGFTVTGATSEAGIYLYHADHCSISNNIVTNNGEGIWLVSSCDNTLSGNIASLNTPFGYGIILDDSNGNMLVNNNVSGDNFVYGIVMYYSDGNVLMDNHVSNVWHACIYFEYSAGNDLTGNTVISDCQGITMYYSNDNTIYNNYFDNPYNAFDNGNNNVWNIPKTAGENIIGGDYLGGNYWSDYAGEDLNGDGLGDTMLPYDSAGYIQNGGDWLPLVGFPDLVIRKVWVNWPVNCTIYYNITNTGDGTAPAGHTTVLFVDDIKRAEDVVPVELAAGESGIRYFSYYTWVHTPPSDKIAACADYYNVVTEE